MKNKSKFKYAAYVPFTGYLNIEISSDVELDEDSLFNLAIEKAEGFLNFKDDFFVDAFEFHKEIVSGNVFHGSLNAFDFSIETEEDSE